MKIVEIEIDQNSPRVETGPVRFKTKQESDWAGVFLRGDYAYPLARTLLRVLDGLERGAANPHDESMLYQLVEVLESCNEGLPDGKESGA